MRIGFVVDGQSERYALPHLLGRITNLARGHILLTRPLYADLQSLAPPAQIARVAHSRIVQLAANGADLAVVLIDSEDNHACPGEWARDVALAVNGKCPAGINAEVVVKHRCLENWLVADLDALRNMPKRFSVSHAIARRVVPNQADNVDGPGVLRQVVNGTYDKTRDAVRIMRTADPNVMARQSRSFRRFLRTIGHSRYRIQSLAP